MCLLDTGCRIHFWRLRLSKKQEDNRLMATTDPCSCSIFLASTVYTWDLRHFQGKRIPRGSRRSLSEVLETSNACLQDTADKHAGQLEDSQNRLDMTCRLWTTQIRLRKSRWDNHRWQSLNPRRHSACLRDKGCRQTSWLRQMRAILESTAR